MVQKNFPARLKCVRRTVSDESPAGEHFAQHELDHGQNNARQATDDGHAEQKAVLWEHRAAARGLIEGWEQS